MNFYKGAFSHDDIMKMPWEQFLMYQEYMMYIERWQTEKGAKMNKMLNRQDEIKYGKKDQIKNAINDIRRKFVKYKKEEKD